MATKTAKNKPSIITSYEDACLALGRISNSLPEALVSMMPIEHQKSVLAYCKLIITLDAIRKFWRPDWKDGKAKYYNYFEIVPDKSGSGFVFSFTYSFNTYTSATVGSRLLFETEEQAIFAASQPKILALYKDYLLYPSDKELRKMKLKELL
jgi:hypothetical protein